MVSSMILCWKHRLLFRIYYTIHDQIDYSLFCNTCSLYFSFFGGKNMLWLNFIHDLNFISFCSKLVIDYHTPKQRKIKFKPRIKLNHNKYPHFPKLNYRVFSRSLFISLRKQIALNDHSSYPPTTLLIKRFFLRLIALFLQDCQLSMEPAFLKSQRFLTISIVVLCTRPRAAGLIGMNNLGPSTDNHRSFV